MGHFAQAAERLGTTQPNISGRIKDLEALVGGILFDRATNPISLTPLGQDLLPHALAALDEVARFAEASQNPKLLPPLLRLGVTELAGLVLVPAFAEALRALYPHMQIELRQGLSVDMEQDLAGGQIDMALCNAPFTQANLRAVPLATFPWLAVCCPGLSQEKRQVLLTSARGTAAHAELTQTQGHLRLVPGAALAGTRQLALAGMGVAMVPEALVAQDLANGSLVAVEDISPPSPLEFSVLFDPDRPGDWLENLALHAARSINFSD